MKYILTLFLGIAVCTPIFSQDIAVQLQCRVIDLSTIQPVPFEIVFLDDVGDGGELVPINTNGPYSRMKVFANPIQQQQMLQKGIAMDHLNSQSKTFVVGEFSSWEKEQIKSLGLATETLIENLSTHYAEKNQQPLPSYKTTSVTTPDAFNLGSMGGFLTFNEAILELDSMFMDYPNLITAKQSIGTTGEGRSIWMVKISDNVNTDETEPEVLYDALHHAREPMALMQLIYYMQYLLENYGVDPEVTYLVNNREMYFIPVLNPDGYVYNQTTDPNGGGMWRKNRRNNGNGEWGVDINRNYDYFWGFDDNGSSPDPASDTYRGPSAFSEPETQAMRDFCNARQFKTTLNYHAYGNHYIYPWGWLPSYYTPDSTQYNYFGDVLSDYNSYNVGTGNETVGYPVNGSADDWMYGEQISKGKMMSLTPEVGDANEGFWPAISFCIPWCDVNLRANLNISWLAGEYILCQPDPPSEVVGTNIFIPANWVNAGLLNSTTASATFITTDPNILSVNNSVNLNNLNIMASKLDSFSLTLASGISNGTILSGIIQTTFSGLVTNDSIQFIYGIPSIIWADSVEIPVQWGGGWNITTEKSHTGTQSMTDSPFNDYTGNDINDCEVTNIVDLSGYTLPRLKFWAQWDIEADWDYVQLSISTDGANFTPLQGNYTNLGVGGAGWGQPIEQLYDGNQSTWVQESIDLLPWDGQQVYFRFTLVSDNWTEYDGYYFDDFVVTGYPLGAAVDENTDQTKNYFLYPSPGNGKVRLGGLKNGESVKVEVYNASFQLLKNVEVNGTNFFDLSSLSSGMYFYRVISDDDIGVMKKWVKE